MTENKENIENKENVQPQQKVVIINNTADGNGIGTAGFVLALIGLFIGWIPVIGWLVWFLGLVLSFIGIFKKPKTLAIFGLIISLIYVIIVGILVGGLLSSSSL